MSAIDDVEQCRKAIRDLRKSGRLSDDLYHKEAVKLAHEYVKLAALDDARSILRGIPRVYFERVQYQQMLNDPSFCDIANEIVDALTEAPPAVTMGGGQA